MSHARVLTKWWRANGAEMACQLEIDGGLFMYRHTVGTAFVNVYRQAWNGEWVNFDGATLAEATTTLHAAVVACRRHLEATVDADPRYTMRNPTRDQLVYGS